MACSELLKDYVFEKKLAPTRSDGQAYDKDPSLNICRVDWDLARARMATVSMGMNDNPG